MSSPAANGHRDIHSRQSPGSKCWHPDLKERSEAVLHFCSKKSLSGAWREGGGGAWGEGAEASIQAYGETKFLLCSQTISHSH